MEIIAWACVKLMRQLRQNLFHKKSGENQSFSAQLNHAIFFFDVYKTQLLIKIACLDLTLAHMQRDFSIAFDKSVSLRALIEFLTQSLRLISAIYVEFAQLCFCFIDRIKPADPNEFLIIPHAPKFPAMLVQFLNKPANAGQKIQALDKP